MYHVFNNVYYVLPRNNHLNQLGKYRINETIAGELESGLENCIWKECMSSLWANCIAPPEFHNVCPGDT